MRRRCSTTRCFSFLILFLFTFYLCFLAVSSSFRFCIATVQLQLQLYSVRQSCLPRHVVPAFTSASTPETAYRCCMKRAREYRLRVSARIWLSSVSLSLLVSLLLPLYSPLALYIWMMNDYKRTSSGYRVYIPPLTSS